MKSLFLVVPFILALACGAGGSDNETIVQDTVEEQTPETNELAVADVEIEPDTAVSEDLPMNTALLYELSNGRAGLFATGLTQEEVEEFAEQYTGLQVERIDLMAEGMAYPGLELTFNGSDTIVLELSESDFTVCRTTVNSDLFTTAEGIGVGSTYEDLKNNYVFEGLDWGNGGNPVAIVEEAGMSFLIEPGHWWQNGMVQGEVPADAKVTSIILW